MRANVSVAVIAASLVIALSHPSDVQAATYTLNGPGECIFLTPAGYRDNYCRAEMVFSVERALFGELIPLTNGAVLTLFYNEKPIAGGGIIWDDTVEFVEPGVCTDACAYVSTDSSGALLEIYGTCFNCAPDVDTRYNGLTGLGGWNLFGALPDPLVDARGSWTQAVASIPLPATLPLMAAAIGIMFGLRQRRLRLTA